MRGPLSLTDWTLIISRGIFYIGGRGGREKKKGIDEDRVESFCKYIGTVKKGRGI